MSEVRRSALEESDVLDDNQLPRVESTAQY